MPNFRDADGLPRRALFWIEQMEAAVGKPVISSNQAMMFCLLRELGLPRHHGLPGRLFDCV